MQVSRRAHGRHNRSYQANQSCGIKPLAGSLEHGQVRAKKGGRLKYAHEGMESVAEVIG